MTTARFRMRICLVGQCRYLILLFYTQIFAQHPYHVLVSSTFSNTQHSPMLAQSILPPTTDFGIGQGVERDSIWSHFTQPSLFCRERATFSPQNDGAYHNQNQHQAFIKWCTVRITGNREILVVCRIKFFTLLKKMFSFKHTSYHSMLRN